MRIDTEGTLGKTFGLFDSSRCLSVCHTFIHFGYHQRTSSFQVTISICLHSPQDTTIQSQDFKRPDPTSPWLGKKPGNTRLLLSCTIEVDFYLPYLVFSASFLFELLLPQTPILPSQYPSSTELQPRKDSCKALKEGEYFRISRTAAFSAVNQCLMRKDI